MALPADLSTWADVARVGSSLMDNHSQRLLALDGTLFDVLLRQKGSDLFDRTGTFLPDQKVALEVLTEFAELSQAQIKYCANDVLYLHKINDALTKILKREKRFHLYEDCLKFINTRVNLDLASFSDDIWSH